VPALSPSCPSPRTSGDAGTTWRKTIAHCQGDPDVLGGLMRPPHERLLFEEDVERLAHAMEKPYG
jgi:hypothetical protein